MRQLALVLAHCHAGASEAGEAAPGLHLCVAPPVEVHQHRRVRQRRLCGQELALSKGHGVQDEGHLPAEDEAAQLCGRKPPVGGAPDVDVHVQAAARPLGQDLVSEQAGVPEEEGQRASG